MEQTIRRQKFVCVVIHISLLYTKYITHGDIYLFGDCLMSATLQ